MVTEEIIQRRSYAIWERRGRPEGRDLEHWLQAKAELEAELRKPKVLSSEYHALLYRFEEWQRTVQPKPRISAPPRVSVAGRVAGSQRSAA